MIDYIERESIIFFKIFVYPVHGCRESQRKGPDWWVPITTPLTKTKKKVGIFFQKKKLFFLLSRLIMACRFHFLNKNILDFFGDEIHPYSEHFMCIFNRWALQGPLEFNRKLCQNPYIYALFFLLKKIKVVLCCFFGVLYWSSWQWASKKSSPTSQTCLGGSPGLVKGPYIGRFSRDNLNFEKKLKIQNNFKLPLKWKSSQVM